MCLWSKTSVLKLCVIPTRPQSEGSAPLESWEGRGAECHGCKEQIGRSEGSNEGSETRGGAPEKGGRGGAQADRAHCCV